MDSVTHRAGPLAGCRVLELGSTIDGPFCGRLLADFGAEVIKVEDPAGDAVRSMGKRYRGVSLYAASILRNKRLIAIAPSIFAQDQTAVFAASSKVSVPALSDPSKAFALAGFGFTFRLMEMKQ